MGYCQIIRKPQKSESTLCSLSRLAFELYDDIDIIYFQ